MKQFGPIPSENGPSKCSDSVGGVRGRAPTVEVRLKPFFVTESMGHEIRSYNFDIYVWENIYGVLITGS